MKLKFSNLDFTPKDINEEQKTLRAVFSTSDVDRHGEVVDQKSWLLDDFAKNPVLLFGHDHSQPPVGKIIGLNYNTEGNLEGTVKFAADEYPFANVIWNLYKGGYMKAFSVGFSAGKVDVVNGQVILKENTLYEISTVSVPANQMALAKSKGLDVTALEEKFIETDEEHDPITCEEKDCPCKSNNEVIPPTVSEEVTPAVTEEPIAVAPVEEKGAVADEVAVKDVMEQKWENMDEVHEIMSAFWEVYMDENTPLESFAALVSETASLLQGVADSHSMAEIPEDMKLALKKGVTPETAQKYTLAMMTKAGKVLSSANRTAIVNAMAALQAVLDADTPPEKSIELTSADTTVSDKKVETPTVRVATTKKTNKARQINKAIRGLLKAKAKIN